MFKFIRQGFETALRQPRLEWTLARRRAPRPWFLDYAVTWRCNARCVMCDTWQAGQENPDLKASELSLDDLEAITRRDAAWFAGLKKIGLTGGEPWLRSDLVEIVRLLHRAAPAARMSLVCNGLVTERILKGLERIKSFFPELVFSVSLDGIGPVHDQVRGLPGFYDHALATIKGALALGFTVTSGMTISRVNCHQVTEVSQLLAGLGVDFSCNLQETGANFFAGGGGGELTPRQKDQVRESLAPFGHHYYMDNVRQQLEGQKRTLPCYAGSTSYFLHPDGDLAICNLLEHRLGNLRQSAWPELAQAPKAWELRGLVKTCTCWSQCEVKNSAASAPWHVLKWLAKSPNKRRFLAHYGKKIGKLAS